MGFYNLIFVLTFRLALYQYVFKKNISSFIFFLEGKMFRRIIFFCFLFSYFQNYAQSDSLFSNLKFEMDYRFRVEQDWDSKKSNGSYREDRSRLRYKFRAGVIYERNRSSFGFRLRTGDPKKQQDPQLTLGTAFKEFGTLPIGFEKVFFIYNLSSVDIWAGKNTFPFIKNNELFWSDNVFPEGISFQKFINLNANTFNHFKITGGHFILGSNNTSFNTDASLSGVQTEVLCFNKRISIFPTFYFFKNIPDIPDGSHSFVFNYSILHLGAKLKLNRSGSLYLKFDLYKNINNYDQVLEISSNLKDQKTGYVLGLKYGQLKNRKDFLIELTYAHLQRYSVLDYMAQNDWARWDYSNFNSPDGRLSNFQGIEFVLAYALSSKTNLVMKYYNVEQLISYGQTKETGQRLRFDLNTRL